MISTFAHETFTNNSASPPALYPLNYLPTEIFNAASEVIQHVKAPPALVGMSFLTSISVACQRHCDVKLPTGQVRPTSLNLITMADSGERKSAVDRLVAKPIHEHDELLLSTANIRDDALSRRLIVNDTSIHSFFEALDGEDGSVALMSDEGLVIMRSELMQNPGLINRAWDGSTLVRDRANGAGGVAMRPRLTVSFMIQPALLNSKSTGFGILRDSGFAARCLMSRPLSTIGGRFMDRFEEDWTHLTAFHNRVRELLAQPPPAERHVIAFDDSAVDRWIALNNSFEMMMQPGQYLNDISDWGSKAMEHMSRIAALLHYFSGQAGPISRGLLECAYVLVWYHTTEFKRIYSSEGDIPEAERDAAKLLAYLLRQAASYSIKRWAYNEIFRCGPIRDRDRLAAAFERLVDRERIDISYGAHRKRFVTFALPDLNVNSTY